MLTVRGFRTLAVVILVSLNLVGCARSYQPFDQTDIGLSPSPFEGKTPDVLGIVANVGVEVQKELPRAELIHVNYQGQCQDLGGLRGVLHLEFAEERGILWSTQYLVGLASVDTLSQTLDLRYRDYTPYHLSAEPLDLDRGLSMSQVAGLASAHISDLGVDGCDIMLSHAGETWHILCTSSGSGVVGHRLCDFEVDAITGAVIANQR